MKLSASVLAILFFSSYVYCNLITWSDFSEKKKEETRLGTLELRNGILFYSPSDSEEQGALKIEPDEAGSWNVSLVKEGD